MTEAFQALDKDRHRYHGFKRPDHCRFTQHLSLCPVLEAEIGPLLPFYALAFAVLKNRYELVTLMGLHQGENLLLNAQGRWRVGYIPSRFRAYPFELAESANPASDQAVICFDRRSGLYREIPDPLKGEARFFDDEGNPQPLLQEAINFFAVRTAARKDTHRAVDAIVAAGLLEPWTLAIENPDPERPLLQGLFRINQPALRELDGNALSAVHEAGGLAIAYGQVFSMGRLTFLRYFYNLSHPKPETLPTNLTDDLLNKLFGEGDEDTLNFEWLK